MRLGGSKASVIAIQNEGDAACLLALAAASALGITARAPTEADALSDPTKLSRHLVGRLPCQGQQPMVVSVRPALKNEVRAVIGLAVNGEELCGGLRNNKQIATNLDLDAEVSHLLDCIDNECFGVL